MDKSFYETLQNDFIMIRHQHNGIECNAELLNKAIASIENAYAELENEDSKNQKILRYCIYTLLDIINEGDREKIYAFADTIHNIPEIGLGKRDFKSFKPEIKAFRKKYGRGYFRSFFIWWFG